MADAAFARIDIDADGELSVVEWNACGDPNAASASGINQPSSGAAAPWDAEEFTAFDADKSGALSADEAAEATRASDPAKTDEEDTARRAGAMFARVDANGDGMMSAEEWSNRNSQTFNDLFGRVDADHNGAISRDEWLSYRDAGYDRAVGERQGAEPNIWRYYYFVVG